MISLETLPPAPTERSGWPWISDSIAEKSEGMDVECFPKISIVTPSYNQGAFIEETIRSVLLQNYPNLEYIIVDGASTDNSVAVIRKYEDWIDYWVSEPDGGQSDAINKGFGRCTGEVINWINSDDILMPGALLAVAREYIRGKRAIAWVGSCRFIDRSGSLMRVEKPFPGNARQFANWGVDMEKGIGAAIAQPSCFFRKSAFDKVGGVSTSLDFTMDVELWMKLAELGDFQVLDGELSCARWYPEIKTLSDHPSRMMEHVVLCWEVGERDIARQKMLEFGEIYFREQSLSRMLLGVIRKVYSMTLKKVIRSIRG